MILTSQQALGASTFENNFFEGFIYVKLCNIIIIYK
jgi:hypothetical protein